MSSLAVALATGLGAGFVPAKLAGSRKWTGAGLLGSLQGLLLAPLLPENPYSLALVLAASVAASSWLCGRAEKILGRHDDPRIVLDEIVGFWFAQALLPRRAAVLVAAFAAFRAFDSLKPAPASWLERLPGGWGIVGDDVGAGIMANILVRAALPWLMP